MIPNLNLKFFLSKEKNHIICPNVENNNRLAVNWDQISLLDKTNLGLGCLDTKESMTEASEILSAYQTSGPRFLFSTVSFQPIGDFLAPKSIHQIGFQLLLIGLIYSY